MEWNRAFRYLGLGLLLVVAAVTAVAIGLGIDRFARGRDRALAQELVIHHFERSSWFALNAGKYESLDSGLARGFRESADWHARRAREFQRMDTGDVARESERDAVHDLTDARLLGRALRCDSLLGAQNHAAGSPERDEGKARDIPP
jgi:hypothetical protein